MSYLALMYTIAALYHFTRFKDPGALKSPLAQLCHAQNVKGTLLLAPEGINGTIAGPRVGIDAVLAHLRTLPGCADLEWKEAVAKTPPFGKMKVRLKREIVTMGQPDVDPRARVGHYVDPADGSAVRWTVHRTMGGVPVFALIGFMGGLFGIGAGWANMPALNLLMGAPLKLAAGTSGLERFTPGAGSARG